MNALAGRDTINLGIGQLPDDLPLALREKGLEAFAQGQTRYTSNQGNLELRKLIAAYHSQKNGRNYSADQVIVTNGAEGALWNIYSVYLDRDEEVLIPEIAFSVYQTIAELHGGKAVTYKLNKDFSIDLADLERKINGKTKFIVINSPNNPTGAVLTSEQVSAVTEIAERKGIYIISDEIYSELFFGEKQPSSPMEYSDRVLTVDGISKRAAATGLRIGWTICPEEIAKPMIVANQYVTTCASSVSQYAAIASLDGSTDDFVKRIREELREKGEYAWKTLKSIKGIHVEKPEGAFYIFPDISAFDTSREVALRILDEVDVLTIPGLAFGERGRNHIRISFAVDFDRLKEALSRIKHLFENWE
nr:aminotransferase class I/II-fold pyridoxal phosphate-dependent enzyme [Spirochaeta isovalerica]